MIAKEDVVIEKNKIITPKKKEANDLMFEYLISSIEEEKSFKKFKKIENSFLCQFNKMYWIVLFLLVLIPVTGTYYWHGVDNLIKVAVTCLLMGFLFSIALSGFFTGMMGLIFDSEYKCRDMFKKTLFQRYNIELKKEVLQNKEGLGKVITMLEDLSNNSYVEELLINPKRQISTSRGNKVTNFAEAMLFDIKDWGVSVDNIEYHIDLAVNSFHKEFLSKREKDKIKEENKDLELFFS